MNERSENVVRPTDERLRMDAYYYSFTETGVLAIDRILSAIAHAGKAYHHTESWQEETRTPVGLTGNTPEMWIQNAANAAAITMRNSESKLTEVPEFDAEMENLRYGRLPPP